MDVSCPPWLDFLHGGLHMQVTHHLFPRLPRHRLRLASERFVQPWCRQEGLTYSSMGFVKGNSKVLGTLQEVGKQLKILGIVASAQAHGLKH
jgi:delta8-fatty-acid desaturase